MSLLAVGLVVAAAFCHASWNLLAKRSSGGVAFVWLIQVTGALFYAPVVLGFLIGNLPEFTPSLFAASGASALAHLAYFLSLQRGYQGGDLSLVYPVARGVGPALATTGAILLYGERPSLSGLLGAALVIAGVFLISMPSPQQLESYIEQQRHVRLHGLKWGGITGLFIAMYSMID
ncbi:MAG: EamA family transporter, partial [Spirochaetales bacterium]